MSTSSLASTIVTPQPTEKYSLSSSKGQCAVHGPSQTPKLDHHLKQPHIREALRTLGTLEYGNCTRCTTETLATTLSTYVKDLRAAKKSGELSKEERKALKKESKFLFKSVKKDLKTIWKD